MRSIREGRISLTRCRAIRVVLNQLASVKSPSPSSPSSSSSPVRSITRFTRFEEAKICFTEARLSSSESKASPSSSRSAVRADGSNWLTAGALETDGHSSAARTDRSERRSRTSTHCRISLIFPHGIRVRSSVDEEGQGGAAMVVRS
jgi:hypothetical protein